MSKKSKLFAIGLLTTLVMVATLSAFSVTAQNTATVVVLDSVGGTVDPPGVTTPADGATVTLTATPTDDFFVFSYWVISSEVGDTESFDNPYTFTVMGGATYAIQAVFEPIQPPPGATLPPTLENAAIVIVLPSAGGTTSPPAGTYALADATSLMLTATAQEDWNFAYWTICGEETDHGSSPVNWAPAENPYNVNHGYGATYYYQAIFTPEGVTPPVPTPTPTSTIGGMSTDTLIIIALVVVIIVILIAFAVFATKRKR